MGCESSNADMPSAPKNSIILRALNKKQKDQVIAEIEKDDMLGLAVVMDELGKLSFNIGAVPQCEISDEKMNWTMIHFCCRWDSEKCLEYLLREFFSEQPKSYPAFVNSQTIEGYTCLHLCAIWMAEECFKVLNHFGGLSLCSRDGHSKTPLKIAEEYKTKSMIPLLKQY